jgi:hypothetical protein
LFVYLLFVWLKLVWLYALGQRSVFSLTDFSKALAQSVAFFAFWPFAAAASSCFVCLLVVCLYV